MFISSAYRCAMRSIGPFTLGMVRRVARQLVCIPTYNEASNILALIEAVDDGADLAIGSRYIAGGAIEGWAISRRILSATANIVARQALRLRTRDCTGGFRCYSLRSMQFLVPRPLRSSGYSALIELLTRCERADLSIKEIPITFTDRTHGRSKISRQEIFRAMLTVARLAGRRS